MIVRSDRWHDGRQWEATCPDSWKFFKDTSIRGWPDVFESQHGSRLQVGMSSGTTLSGYDWSEAPKDLTHEQQTAYLIALQLARSENWRSWSSLTIGYFAKALGFRPALTPRKAGAFLGFTYKRRAEDQRQRWGGVLCAGPIMAYLFYSALPEHYEADSAVAWRIVESVTFR